MCLTHSHSPANVLLWGRLRSSRSRTSGFWYVWSHDLCLFPGKTILAEYTKSVGHMTLQLDYVILKSFHTDRCFLPSTTGEMRSHPVLWESRAGAGNHWGSLSTLDMHTSRTMCQSTDHTTNILFNFGSGQTQNPGTRTKAPKISPSQDSDELPWPTPTSWGRKFCEQNPPQHVHHHFFHFPNTTKPTTSCPNKT